MYVKLTDGQELKLTVVHEHFTDAKGRLKPITWVSGHPRFDAKKKRSTLGTSIREMRARTIITIVDAKTKILISTAAAHCSVLDQFRRKEGLLIALRKATSSMDKETRRQIWERVMNIMSSSKPRAISPTPAPGIEPGAAAS